MTTPARGPAPGLCGTCAHARVIISGKGSIFFLCRRSLTDPSFPKYPPLPVLVCRGYEEASADGPEAPSADDPLN
jgi:hypothetical protein